MPALRSGFSPPLTDWRNLLSGRQFSPARLAVKPFRRHSAGWFFRLVASRVKLRNSRSHRRRRHTRQPEPAVKKLLTNGVLTDEICERVEPRRATTTRLRIPHYGTSPLDGIDGEASASMLIDKASGTRFPDERSGRSQQFLADLKTIKQKSMPNRSAGDCCSPARHAR